MHSRVWAPRRQRVAFIRLDRTGKAASVTELEPEGDGYFSGSVSSASSGDLYKLRLDDAGEYPDPASRAQPAGPHGASQVVDPERYVWRDASWRGVTLPGQVLYEMHVGTFTSQGTWRAAQEHFVELADVGVTVIEMMPIAEFPGGFGWGYDGVSLFAPYHHYGTPDDLRRFVDAAHGAGLGVILDVVYNHFGPDGNYLEQFSEHYFKGDTDWGRAINFDGDGAAPVRDLFLANASYWIDEFHFDGLRLDATQQIFDGSAPHILREIRLRVHDAAGGRATIVVAENEPQDARLLRPLDRGGYALDAVWNDDFHHSATVLVTGRDEAYYGGYRGHAQELVSSAKYGFLYQGQWYEWQLDRRGTPAYDIPAWRLVNFIENHDQVANSVSGRRVHQLTSPSRYRAAMALLLLLPQTPMLFQGQEFAASAPFRYFADHTTELARLVRRGRAEFLGQFASAATMETAASMTNPSLMETFQRCKLDWSERDAADHAPALALVKDLLRLRREDPTISLRASTTVPDSASRPHSGVTLGLDGAVLGDDVFALRYFGASGALDRLLVANFGRRMHPVAVAEPLMAPPPERVWRVLWSSEHPAYGGCGTASVEADDGGWWLPAEAVVLLAAVERDVAGDAPKHPREEKEARAQWKARHDETAR